MSQTPPSGCDCCSHEKSQETREELSPSNSLVQKLKKNEDVKEATQNFGALHWDQVTGISYEDSEWQVVVIPFEIKNDNNETQVLLAGTQDSEEFVILVFGMSINSATTRDELDGTFKYYLPTGEAAITARIAQGEIQQVEKTSNLPSTRGIDMGCFTDCLGELAGEFWQYCYLSCSLCFALPNPYNPTCYACAACIGGGAFWCIVACWE